VRFAGGKNIEPRTRPNHTWSEDEQPTRQLRGRSRGSANHRNTGAFAMILVAKGTGRRGSDKIELPMDKEAESGKIAKSNAKERTRRETCVGGEGVRMRTCVRGTNRHGKKIDPIRLNRQVKELINRTGEEKFPCRGGPKESGEKNRRQSGRELAWENTECWMKRESGQHLTGD